MKSVTKYISIALILAAGLFSSCRKDLTFSDSAADNQITVTATIANEGTKVFFGFNEDGTTLKSAWEATDNIVGWDENGNAIELEIGKIDNNGAAVFKPPVSGSAPIPTSGKVYMIYAPDKHYSDVNNKSLEFDLSSQSSDKVPALMTATGEVTGNVLSLTFKNELAIVAVKDPKFPFTEATTVSGLRISGDNINTVATFGSDDKGVTVTPSAPGTITKACTISANSSGNTTANVLFAVLPNSTSADIDVSTVSPAGYLISFEEKSFTAGQCYLLDTKELSKQIFAITIEEGITHGSATTSPADSCKQGQTVTVIPDADEDYVVDKVTYNDGTEHDITSTRSFTMPQKDVTVNVTFRYAFLDGAFTVAADDGNGHPKKVKFTNGNLYYHYDLANEMFIPCIEKNQYGWNTPQKGYFYFNKTVGKALAAGRHYDGSDAVDENDKLFCSEGTPLAIDGTSDLFVLSKDEWIYLLGVTSGRSDSNRFARAKYNNKLGLLIFPDNYTLPEGYTSSGGTGVGTINLSTTESFPSENIPEDVWNGMNTAGVVFLPAAGLTSTGQNRGSENATGYYQSSDAYSSSFGYILLFNGTQIDSAFLKTRGEGYTIRLVQKIPAMPN